MDGRIDGVLLVVLEGTVQQGDWTLSPGDSSWGPVTGRALVGILHNPKLPSVVCWQPELARTLLGSEAAPVLNLLSTLKATSKIPDVQCALASCFRLRTCQALETVEGCAHWFVVLSGSFKSTDQVLTTGDAFPEFDPFRKKHDDFVFVAETNDAELLTLSFADFVRRAYPCADVHYSLETCRAALQRGDFDLPLPFFKQLPLKFPFKAWNGERGYCVVLSGEARANGVELRPGDSVGQSCLFSERPLTLEGATGLVAVLPTDDYTFDSCTETFELDLPACLRQRSKRVSYRAHRRVPRGLVIQGSVSVHPESDVALPEYDDVEDARVRRAWKRVGPCLAVLGPGSLVPDDLLVIARQPVVTLEFHERQRDDLRVSLAEDIVAVLDDDADLRKLPTSTKLQLAHSARTETVQGRVEPPCTVLRGELEVYMESPRPPLLHSEDWRPPAQRRIGHLGPGDCLFEPPKSLIVKCTKRADILVFSTPRPSPQRPQKITSTPKRALRFRDVTGRPVRPSTKQPSLFHASSDDESLTELKARLKYI